MSKQNKLMLFIMKKITLLLAVLLLGNVVQAAEMINFSDNRRFPISLNDAEPIQFTERGIEFFIFPDGQFDFNTVPSQGENYYRTGRRDNNATYGSPNTINLGIRIEHDNFGRIRRIGNVFINYDFNDRIKRIGSVYMTYNRFALSQVGGLKIVYNRRGQIVNYIGFVKGRNFNGNYNSNDIFNSNDNFNDNFNDNDTENDYYYYRNNGTKAKIEEEKKVEKK
jgi:hypothetical protein